eukprot:CAMPEP_0206449718 /NCGR_PEP_ID=MMETSP0324_2-20121206/18271_1 /ASSEMBLY_ACC=CAM_ASM_000836 /TAXON_ID=2866 /ORGANISM="Crypthecodinium cohnii, Strain Seligo" /LENGTH=443 /DNA_ID=CAMNT_0053919179 /DNA_START=76 /DNA_END=1407 /DNA_ORIENTATION=-
MALRTLALLPLTAAVVNAEGPWLQWLGKAEQFLAPQEAFSSREAPDASKWDTLTQLLKGWEFTTNYAISVGTAEHGQLFLYEGGNFTMKTKIPTGSTSKWPSAMLFAGLVNDGTIKSLDDPINKYLDWWTKDAKDPRSEVTFRMLLSFTSGFGGGHPGEEMNTRAARNWRTKNGRARASHSLEERLSTEIGMEGAAKCNTTTGDITECAKSIYESVKLIGQPGKVYSYNSNHLQLAAAVSLAATGLKDIHEVVKKYLVDAYGMADSSYPGKCPDFGGSLVTTGADYERFLSATLARKVLSKAIIDASEEDATPFMADMYTLYGDYGFGHFLWCFDSVDGMTDACGAEKTHVDPGAFGFIPMIDRKRSYYFQVVGAEIAPTGDYPLSGIPEYLAVAIKPHVDAILGDAKDEPARHLTHSPAFLSLAVADVNYCLNCKLHPEACS